MLTQWLLFVPGKGVAMSMGHLDRTALMLESSSQSYHTQPIAHWQCQFPWTFCFHYYSAKVVSLARNHFFDHILGCCNTQIKMLSLLVVTPGFLISQDCNCCKLLIWMGQLSCSCPVHCEFHWVSGPSHPTITFSVHLWWTSLGICCNGVSWWMRTLLETAWWLPSEQGKICRVHWTHLRYSLQCMPHLPSSGLRKCLLFWWLLWQGAVLAIESVIQCWFSPYQWQVVWSDCSVTPTVIMWKPWVVEPSLTCWHYDLHVLHSSNLASDVSTLFLFSCFADHSLLFSCFCCFDPK